jgi:hypothetical protein
VDSDKQNRDGLRLLEWVAENKLQNVLSCIVLTGQGDDSVNLRQMLRHYRFAGFVEKSAMDSPDFFPELLAELDRSIDRLEINFGLTYDDDTDDCLSDLYAGVRWNTNRPNDDMLAREVEDLFGKLFFKALRLFVTPMLPGLTGASVVSVQPTWEQGLGLRHVVKIGRRDKIAIEEQHFKTNVQNLLPHEAGTLVEVCYTRNLGALSYRFATNERRPMAEFDEFYKRCSGEIIARDAVRIFRKVCFYWYSQTRNKRIQNIPRAYFDAFGITKEALAKRVQEEVFPQLALNSRHPQLGEFPLINPFIWIDENRFNCSMPVLTCITHGDLTGRNVMVDFNDVFQNGDDHAKFWLIDFYRTYESHVLRDFVILETDIKYRLMDSPTNKQFLHLEQALQEAEEKPFVQALTSETRKAYDIISGLRKLSQEMIRGFDDNAHELEKEYLLAVLVATLNVLRLRHIDTGRKRQAMLSASMICKRLNDLDRRPSGEISFERYLALAR